MAITQRYKGGGDPIYNLSLIVGCVYCCERYDIPNSLVLDYFKDVVSKSVQSKDSVKVN